MFFKKPKRMQINEEFAGVLKNSISSVFSTMFNIKVTIDEYNFEENYQNSGDISGIINMFEENSNAALIVSMPKSTAIPLMEKVYQASFPELTPECVDGVGEITNMIYGSIKKDLEGSGLKLKMAIPKVILGQHHIYIHDESSLSLIMSVNTPIGPFDVTVSVKEESLKKAG